MPVFKYDAVNRDGAKLSGSITLPNESEVRVYLRQRGARATKIQRESMFNRDFNLSFGRLVGLEELAVVTRQLSVMIEAGVPILQALEILHSGEKNLALKKALTKISENVSSGSAFWEALAKHPSIFDNLYVYLVRAGEIGGALDIILRRLAKYLEDSVKLTRLVKGAMVYPAIVVLVGVCVTFGLVVFIVPQFESLIVNSGGELPAITKFVIDVSHFCQDYFWVIVMSAVASVIGFKQITSTPKGKKAWHQILLASPGIKDLVVKSAVARFTRTMGTMLSSGVNLIDALEICKMALDNVVIQDAIQYVRKEVESGESLTLPLGRTKIFPSMVVQMINVGENTGALDQMLVKIAEFYEQEVEAVVSALTKLIEPIILVVLGGVVTVILIAMYLPIFKLADTAT